MGAVFWILFGVAWFAIVMRGWHAAYRLGQRHAISRISMADRHAGEERAFRVKRAEIDAKMREYLAAFREGREPTDRGAN